MKSGTITGLLGGVIVAGFSLGAFAEMKENPYQVIIDRNPFGLRPVPIVEPPKPPEIPAPPPLKIKLTGITTLLGPPRAILEFTDPQTQKTDRPPPFSENDTYKDNITIVSIDAENKRVRIKNGDAETTLDFEKDGIKPSGGVASAAPVPHPGVTPLNTGVPPVPTAIPAAGQPVNNNGRTSIVGGGNPVSAVPNTFNPGGLGSSANVLPTRTLRTDTGAAIVGGYQPYQPAQAQPAQQLPTMTREEIEARIEAQRRFLEEKGHPQSRILPPTSMGRALNSPPVPAPR